MLQGGNSNTFTVDAKIRIPAHQVHMYRYDVPGSTAWLVAQQQQHFCTEYMYTADANSNVSLCRKAPNVLFAVFVLLLLTLLSVNCCRCCFLDVLTAAAAAAAAAAAVPDLVCQKC